MRTATQQDRRRRRRKTRIQILVIYAFIALGLAWFFESQATTTILLVRHAEQIRSADPSQMMDEDPMLSAAGQARVQELTRQLVDADVIAGIDAVYATPYRRSQQTAAGVADALDLPINSYDAQDTEDVLETILDDHKGQIVLVVGHSNTVPELIANLGASKNVPPIDHDEFDNLYVVSIPWFGKTKTLRLRYGMPYEPGAASETSGNP